MGRLLDFFFNKYPYTDFHELNADWLISATKEMLEIVDNLNEWKVEHEAEYEELKKLYDDLVSGNYPETFENSLKEWIERYGVDIIAESIKFVFFELSDDGYFVAHIPDKWENMRFGTTGLDISIPGYDYGHLVLSY